MAATRGEWCLHAVKAHTGAYSTTDSGQYGLKVVVKHIPELIVLLIVVNTA